MELINPIDKLGWIKELVRAEQQMEEKGVIDFDYGFDPAHLLATQSLSFIKLVKESFVEAASSFNQLKGSAVGRVKIYGISNTDADFMLFRNGLKLIFSLKEPGVIGIRYQFVGAPSLGVAANPDAAGATAGEEEFLLAKWGAFGELQCARRVRTGAA
jgi:hypothetical protein